jgi:hypothetical protein
MPGSSHTNVASSKAAQAEAREELAVWRRALETSLADQLLDGDYAYLVRRLVSAEIFTTSLASLTVP